MSFVSVYIYDVRESVECTSRLCTVHAQAANKHSATFYETSAKTNENVDEVFRKLAHEMLQIYDRKLVSYKLRTKRRQGVHRGCCSISMLLVMISAGFVLYRSRARKTSAIESRARVGRTEDSRSRQNERLTGKNNKTKKTGQERKRGVCVLSIA